MALAFNLAGRCWARTCALHCRRVRSRTAESAPWPRRASAASRPWLTEISMSARRVPGQWSASPSAQTAERRFRYLASCLTETTNRPA